MTDPPLMRKSASKSPPILPAHLTPPRPRSTTTTPPPASSTSQQHSHNISTSDIGVLKLSGQVSQNDERLPPTTSAGQTSLGSGSESGSSGPLDPSISQLPFLDISPAGPSNTSISLDPTQQAHTQEAIQRRRTAYYAADSQSVDALSFPDMSTHPGPAVLGETSFTHNSDNSINNSSDQSTISIHSGNSTISIRSGSNSSNRTHSSGSQVGHSSGSLNSRSSGSQAESQPESTLSDISFSNVETSTPRQTPNRHPSQLSTPSDGDQHLLSSPLSPTGRYSTSQRSPDYPVRGGSSAGGSMDHFVRSAVGLPGPSPPSAPLTRRMVTTIPEDRAEEEEEEEHSSGQLALHDLPTEILGRYDSNLKETLANNEGAPSQPVQLVDDGDDDDDDGGVGDDEIDLEELADFNSQDIHGTVGSTPPVSRLLETKMTTSTAASTTSTLLASGASSSSSSRVASTATGKKEQKKEDEVGDGLAQNDYYTSDEDDDSNPSNTTTGPGIDLHISQSQANIEEYLLPRSRQASLVMPQPSAPLSSNILTSSAAAAVMGVNKTSVQTVTAGTQTDQTADLAQDMLESRARTPTPPSRVGSAASLSDSPSEKGKRPLRGSRRTSGSLGSQELASSQNSGHSTSSAPSSFIERLARAQQEDGNVSDEGLEGPIHPILSKRRKVGVTRVPSSVEDEAEKQFWLGSDIAEPTPPRKERNSRARRGESDSDDEESRQRGSRSRSGSQDISSFPDEGLSELDFGPFTDGSQQAGGEEGEEAAEPEAVGDGPSTSPPASPVSSPPTRKSRRRVGSPPPEPPRVSPKRAPARQLRSRSTSAANLIRGSQSSQTLSQPSSTTPARVSLRRMQSTVDASRVYKTDDPVWARWRKSYYAGKVVRKNSQLYDIHFLDNDIASCENTQIRPFKLKLGTHVMAKKTESMDYEAAVEGIQMSTVLEQSRVDVRFGDETEANLSLNHISLTTEMMAQLDEEMNWDSDGSTAAGPGAGTGPSAKSASKRGSTSQVRREASLVEPLTGPSYSQDLFSTQQTSSTAGSPILATPTKGKNNRFTAAQKSFAAPSTPTRRSKGSGQSLGLSTPVRRAKALLDLFKDMRFVLSLTGPGGSKDLEREISSKIKAGGGTIIEDYTTLMDPTQEVNLTNVVLISFTTLRTAKYISALALNIPRLSYRWIDACSEARQLQPHHSYHLPTGFSSELQTIVSSIPQHSTGIFDGLIIGLCGGLSIRNAWERNLLAAGAREVKAVHAATGPTNCNYIVFFNTKAYDLFIKSNKPVPSLCDEWLIQCLINQRIVSIHGHTSYTDLEKRDNPQQQQQQPQHHQSHPHHSANTSTSGGHSS